MRKISCFILSLLSFAFFAQAQTNYHPIPKTVRFGIDPGVALSKASFTPFSGDHGTYTGFDGGGLVEIGMKKVKFLGEVNYTMIGVKLNNGNVETTYKNSYITIPLMAKYNMDRINVFTGFQMGFLLSAKIDSSNTGTSIDSKDQIKSSDFGWVFGGEIKVAKNVFVGVRYVLGLTNISERLNYEIKNRYVSFRVGYMF